jgi:hypothetical protein
LSRRIITRCQKLGIYEQHCPSNIPLSIYQIQQLLPLLLGEQHCPSSIPPSIYQVQQLLPLLLGEQHCPSSIPLSILKTPSLTGPAPADAVPNATNTVFNEPHSA